MRNLNTGLKCIFSIATLFLFLLPATLSQPPGLNVRQGADVAASNGGIIAVGELSKAHIAIDNDDIQSKSNSMNFGRLDLNFFGGDVLIGGPDNILYMNRNMKGVGLGTAFPDGSLDIDFGGTGSIVAGTPLGNGPGWLYFAPNTDRWDMYAGNGGFYLVLNGTGVSYLTVDRNGKVGVRMATNPSSDLHVKQATGNNYDLNGLRLEYGDNSNYWNTLIDIDDDYVLAFNGEKRVWFADDDGSYNQSSDRRLKEDIDEVTSVLDRVLQLRPVTYKFRAHPDAPKRSWGFIAQEVENLFPDFVSEKAGFMGLAYDNFAVVSIKAIQELNSTIDQQAEEINLLKEHMQDLQSKLETLQEMLDDQ